LSVIFDTVEQSEGRDRRSRSDSVRWKVGGISALDRGCNRQRRGTR